MQSNDMTTYYDYREAIRKLYINDSANNGDLVSSVLELRDKRKNIESIKVAIQENSINVELSDETTPEEVNSISEEIAGKIRDYILNNSEIVINNLPDKSNEAFDYFMDNSSNIYCDICIVGKSIIFNL